MVEVKYWKDSDFKGSGKNQEPMKSGCCVRYLVLVEQVNDSSRKIFEKWRQLGTRAGRDI